MYNNLKTQVNNYFDEQLNKFTNKLNTITNCEILNHWYYKDMLTDKAFKEVYRENAINQDGLLSETVKTKMIKRFTNKNEKDRQRYLSKLEKAENAKISDNITIIVTWNYNKTWGKNPTAEIISDAIRTTASASGCGYDKESAAISSAFNAHPEVMKILYNHAENNGEFTYSIYKTAGVPWFDGGCGVSCFYSVFEKCGYIFKDISHSKTTDVYQIIKAV